MSKPQPQSDGAVCRELWAAIEARPPLRVGSVIVSDRRYRWACLVVVPWSRYAIEVDCREDLDALVAKLEQFDAAGSSFDATGSSFDAAGSSFDATGSPFDAAGLAASVADNVGGRSTEPAELLAIAAEPPDKWRCPKCGRRTESAFSNCDDCVEPLEVNAFTSKAKPKRKAAGADNVGGQLELGLF